MDNELRALQQLYIQESNAFIECLRQKVPLHILEKKREQIRQISRLIDERSRLKDPASTNKRAS